MEDKEKKAIQKTLIDLQEDLEPRDVAPFLWQHDFLTQWQFEALIESNSPRHRRCLQLMTIIVSEESRCTFQGLLAALRYKNAYPFLADKLERQFKNLRTEDCDTVINGAAGCIAGNDERLSPSREHVIYSRDTGVSPNARLYEPVKKIDVFKANRAKMAELANKLERLSHDGNVDRFRQLVTKIDRIYKRNKLDAVRDIEERMEFADMRFIALEAVASSRRVSYDVTLYGDQVFGDMESVIPYTTNPRVSSMTYLARYGSAVSMLESIDNGLAILQYSKHHAEHVVPCKETGMVYYIEVNLLSQKYEKEPNTDLKMKILKTAEVAMSQFNGEDEAVQKDYQRMLMLNMVFCRLGIGLFGNKIENVDLEETDTEAAKEYLDFIERPDVWKGMEKRRKMLFQVAKAELYHQRKQFELAQLHAKEAVRFAEENHWNAELPNLKKRLEVIDNALNCKRSMNPPSTRDPIESWLDDLDNDSLEGDDCTYETDEDRGANDGQADMQYLKLLWDHSNGIDQDALNMLDLKLGPEGERTTDQIQNMQLLKSPCDQSDEMKNSTTEMQTLKLKAFDSRCTASPLTDMHFLKSKGFQSNREEDLHQLLNLKSPCDQSDEMKNSTTEMQTLKLKACDSRCTASSLADMQFLKSPGCQSNRDEDLHQLMNLKSPCDQSDEMNNSTTEMKTLKLKACDSRCAASSLADMQFLKSPGCQSNRDEDLHQLLNLKSPCDQSHEMKSSTTEMQTLKLKACDSRCEASSLADMQFLKSPGCQSNRDEDLHQLLNLKSPCDQSDEMKSSTTEMQTLKLKACDSRCEASSLADMQFLKSPGCQSNRDEDLHQLLNLKSPCDQSDEMKSSTTEMQTLKLKACDSRCKASSLADMQFLKSPGCQSNRDEDLHQLLNLKSPCDYQHDVTESISNMTHTHHDVTESISNMTHSQHDVTESISNMTHNQPDVTKSISNMTHTHHDVTESISNMTHTHHDVTESISNMTHNLCDVTKSMSIKHES